MKKTDELFLSIFFLVLSLALMCVSIGFTIFFEIVSPPIQMSACLCFIAGLILIADAFDFGEGEEFHDMF